LYKDSEKTGGERPIDLIKATHPVVIVDEPQSVDGGLEGKGKKALERMNPLCTLRYSATHLDKHHMVYRLDAVDAYERRLVKQIEVASATVEDAHNRPYVKLSSTRTHRGTVEARVELDVKGPNGKVRRKEVPVNDGDDLEQTTRRALYRDFRIGEIRAGDDPWMELRLPGGEVYLRPGEGHGNIDEDPVAREMIRRTIREHLDKEKRLRPQGIKVLSLFFVPKVDLYREYDEDGHVREGLYARIFEEEYKRLANYPDYRTLFEEVDLDTAAEDVHEGYFSIDKRGVFSEPDLTRDGGLRNQRSRDDAERAYNLIMKHKERLLSFEEPLKFIFSHSALREGWDNPNVFQICSLRDIRTERERRQTIGRGLRICVNQEGQRVRGFEVNTLTVVAREGYKEFAENLQKEIEKETGIRFGIVEPHQFAAVTVTADDGSQARLGVERSQELWDHLRATGYIDAKGKVQDELRRALKSERLVLPDSMSLQATAIARILRDVAGRLEIKNADERRQVRPRKAVLQSAEFKGLWDRIKHKTTYRVRFDNEKLVESCIEAVRRAPPIPKTRLQWRKADLSIGEAGVMATERDGANVVVLDETNIELPDILTELQDRTQLTRRTIYRVLTGSQRLTDFGRNPQAFIELVGEAINRCKRLAVVDGIKYERLGDEHYYAQELFEEEELTGYLKNMLEVTQKSLYEQVIYDSDTEAAFADAMEKNGDIKLYAKLPGWFRVPTPLGTYNPDWAVLVERDGTERLYLVVETKSGLFADDLRDKESAKIECGKAHFKALKVRENPAEYRVARSLEEIFTS
ncbi:MAG: restriction endonuclease subunit R, partial [Dehalococcoidia bacterium]